MTDTLNESTTIHERVGGVRRVPADRYDIRALEHADPTLERRYELIKLVTELPCSVTGGSETYTVLNTLEARPARTSVPTSFARSRMTS